MILNHVYFVYTGLVYSCWVTCIYHDVIAVYIYPNPVNIIFSSPASMLFLEDRSKLCMSINADVIYAGVSQGVINLSAFFLFYHSETVLLTCYNGLLK